MGRVKVPRCDNCGAPVEFAMGAAEARCEYCNEVLIRELPLPAPAPYRPPPEAPPAVVSTKASVAPFVIVALATLGIAGASSVATFASHVKPLPEPAAVANVVPDALGARLVKRESVSVQGLEAQKNGADPAQASETTVTRGRLRTRSTASAAPIAASSAEPAKPPPFNTNAAIAGLDAAKAKAEASCRASSGVRLFIQMGFDADGVNRRAALSDPKDKGTREAKCALRIFRSVRIPAFDMATRPSGLGRPVAL